MAKKGNRQIFNLECAVCKSKNYVSGKNVLNTKEKIALGKFCKKCRKKTTHNEVKIK